MRRVVRHIIVFGLLGAAVTVAVAWGFAVVRPGLKVERNEQGAFVIDGRPWQVVQERRWGMSEVWWMDLAHGYVWSFRSEAEREAMAMLMVEQYFERHPTRVGAMPSGRSVVVLEEWPRWGEFAGSSRSSEASEGEDAEGPEAGSDTAFGVPMRAMWMQATCDFVGNTTANEALQGGVMLRGQASARGNDFLALPYWVIWRGFLVNTLFYGALLWLVCGGWRMMRSATRRRRGRCVRCNYDLRGRAAGSVVCPECGATAVG